MSLKESLDFSMKNRIIKKSERFENFEKRKHTFLEKLQNNTDYQKFKTDYLNGQNTRNRMEKFGTNIDDDTFKDLEMDLKKEQYFDGLFSDSLNFKEIINYVRYLRDEYPFMTIQH